MIIWIASVEGGTTLVKRLAEQGSGTPCYEEFEANPFPAANPFLSARDSPHGLHSLCTALLLQDRMFRTVMPVREDQNRRHVKRLSALPVSQGKPSRSFVLCDFHPAKSLIEAEYVLPTHEQREVVRSLYRLLRVPEPDLVVYLRAASDVIVSRLRRHQETVDVDTTAIERACLAHEAFFRRYKGEKVELDTTFLDYVDDSQALASILREVPLLYQRTSS